ncbi:MAG: radical SAM protein [Candidatus Heimdallarchaeaceae archaeon]
MKAYVSCVACEQRELDAQRVLDYLKKNNVVIVSNPRLADYSFVITCGVDSVNENKSIFEIRRVVDQMKEDSRLIVGGCLPSISPEKLSQLKIYHTFTPRTIESLDDVLKLGLLVSDINTPNRSIYDTDPKNEEKQFSARERFEQAKNGYKVVIADGCLGACSYCMIREATGRLKSKSLDEVIDQVKQGMKNKEATIMLMAGDTGAYGQDIGLNFVTLLRELVSLDGDSHLYLHDFGVNWLIKDLPSYLEVFELAEHKKRIGGMTIPIQSGSDYILSRMNRKYRRKDVIKALRCISHYSFDIGTHIMVGFPGETDADFDDTIDLLEQVNFNFITCFPYSEHPRAISSSLDNKVPTKVVEERIKMISRALESKVKVIQ